MWPDLSNLKSLFTGASPDGGWTSGTTVTQPGAFFSTSGDGSLAGLTPGGQGLIGRAMQGAATAMPGGYKMPAQTQGAFGSGANIPATPGTPPPNGDSGQPAWADLIANWRKHMTGGQ